MTDTVQFVKQEGILVSFVNSETPPAKTHYQNSFKYVTEGFTEKTKFFQLVEKEYHVEKEGQKVAYFVYDWVPISVKSHCVPALKAMIDAMSGAVEFKN